MQAIKDIALRMLNVYVSPYVENLNAQDLQLSVLSGMFIDKAPVACSGAGTTWHRWKTDKTGKAEFNGLRLKKSVLERFGLPVEIVAGRCHDWRSASQLPTDAQATLASSRSPSLGRPSRISRPRLRSMTSTCLPERDRRARSTQRRMSGLSRPRSKRSYEAPKP